MPPSSMQFLNSFFYNALPRVPRPDNAFRNNGISQQCIRVQQWDRVLSTGIDVRGRGRAAHYACTACTCTCICPSRRRAALARHTTDANLLLIQGLADVVAQIASSPRFRRIITISSRARFEPLEIAM